MLTSNDIETQLTQRRLDVENLNTLAKQLQNQINAIKQITSVTNNTTSAKTKPVIIASNLFQAQNDVHLSRVLDATYQNTGVKPMLVTVTLLFALTAIAPTGEVYALTDSSNPPTLVVGAAGTQYTGTLNNLIPITFIVLPGNYYEITVSAGTPTINNWIEWI